MVEILEATGSKTNSCVCVQFGENGREFGGTTTLVTFSYLAISDRCAEMRLGFGLGFGIG